jgi:pimeloyl-ACP methyl ester carboxylesterase
MVLIAFRHGLRASELVDLRWEQIDLEHALLHVRRLKNGSPATQPLTGKELRALRRLEREQELNSPFVFRSERGTPFTKRGFQAMVERAKEMALRPSQIRASAAETALMIPDAFALSKRYADLKMPVVIIAGQEDRLIDIDKQSARLHADVMPSTLHRVPGAGHMVHQTATDAVMVAVDEAAGARLENSRISAKQRLA